MITEIIDKYIKVSDIFNKQNKKYKIRVFIDFDFLNIIVDDIKNKLYYPFRILLCHINDLTCNEILDSYNELVEKIKYLGGDEE